MSNLLPDIIRIRIEELKVADAAFCEDRWDMTKPAMGRSIARECSNQVTFARQELEKLLVATEDENKQKITSWDLQTVMEAVNAWLNSSDVFVLTEKGGEPIDQCWIDCKSGSLLTRLIGLFKYRTKEQMGK